MPRRETIDAYDASPNYIERLMIALWIYDGWDRLWPWTMKPQWLAPRYDWKQIEALLDRRGLMEKPGNIENDRRKKTEGPKMKYLLRETDYDDVVLSDSRIMLADIFPNGICIETRGDEITSIRHPVCGDDPEMMARIERGLKLMNKAILDERQ